MTLSVRDWHIGLCWISDGKIHHEDSKDTKFLDDHEGWLSELDCHLANFVPFVDYQTSVRLAPGYRAELALDLRWEDSPRRHEGH